MPTDTEKHYPHQPTALDIHRRGSSLKNYILYPGSTGLVIRDSLVVALQYIWQKKGLPPADFPVVEIEHPADLEHGDWSCNIAMHLARVFKQNPIQIAQEIVTHLHQGQIAGVKSIAAIKPGFINFFLNDSWLIEQVPDILDKGIDFGKLQVRTGKTIMIEHTQPNSHKALHIGHLRNTFLGMAEVRIHQAIGYKVISATYGGDVGPHVAKCLWGLKGVDLDALQTLDEQVAAIQKAYVHGTQAELTDPQAKEEIKKLNKIIYDKSDPAIMELWQKTFAWSVEKHKQLYTRVGSYFDRYYWESEVWQKGWEIVNQNIGTIFEKSEGAVIFDGEKHGLHKRVFITSQGTSPYEAKDLGLEKLKSEEYDCDFSVIQTGNDHIDYFKVVLKALELVLPELAGIFENETYGMVNLPGGKMSTRFGNTITADDILIEMHERAYAEVAKRYPDMTEDAKHQISETIALGATKYAMLKYDPKQDIAFDPATTLSFNGDSGPYLQYVCVRIQSMQDKVTAILKINKITKQSQKDWAGHLDPSERILLRKLYQYPEVIMSAALEYKPNYLCSYLFELAQHYNDFYLVCPVLKAEPLIASARLALSQATLQVLKNGLGLLGIDVPEKM